MACGGDGDAFVVHRGAADPDRAGLVGEVRARHDLDLRSGDRRRVTVGDVEEERGSTDELDRHRIAGVIEPNILRVGEQGAVLRGDVVLALGEAIEGERAIGLGHHHARPTERHLRAGHRPIVLIDDQPFEAQCSGGDRRELDGPHPAGRTRRGAARRAGARRGGRVVAVGALLRAGLVIAREPALRDERGEQHAHGQEPEQPAPPASIVDGRSDSRHVLIRRRQPRRRSIPNASLVRPRLWRPRHTRGSRQHHRIDPRHAGSSCLRGPPGYALRRHAGRPSLDLPGVTDTWDSVAIHTVASVVDRSATNGIAQPCSFARPHPHPRLARIPASGVWLISRES